MALVQQYFFFAHANPNLLINRTKFPSPTKIPTYFNTPSICRVVNFAF